MRDIIKNSKILVTGGTGSWGYGLVKKLLTYEPDQVIVYSRNESHQVKMHRELAHPALTFKVGDIRDKEALIEACDGIDYVFHLAALKHVDICQNQPLEALKTNVLGVQNLIEAAIRGNVKKVINVSSDKAANPSNFYGLTKSIGEKLVLYADSVSAHTRFISVRSGNVIGTSESVVLLFKDQIRQNNRIGITDKAMTRYFVTGDVTSELMLDALTDGLGGEIFLPDMPACKITDLAEVIVEKYGNRDTELKVVGIRPGEKLHEHLISDHEVKHTVLYEKDGKRYFVVLPSPDNKELSRHYAAHPRAQEKSYTSNSSGLMTKDEIEQMLRNGGFLN